MKHRWLIELWMHLHFRSLTNYRRLYADFEREDCPQEDYDSYLAFYEEMAKQAFRCFAKWGLALGLLNTLLWILAGIWLILR